MACLLLKLERYNYDASEAFDYNTFPATRFMNEFGSVYKVISCE